MGWLEVIFKIFGRAIFEVIDLKLFKVEFWDFDLRKDCTLPQKQLYLTDSIRSKIIRNCFSSLYSSKFGGCTAKQVTRNNSYICNGLTYCLTFPILRPVFIVKKIMVKRSKLKPKCPTSMSSKMVISNILKIASNQPISHKD